MSAGKIVAAISIMLVAAAMVAGCTAASERSVQSAVGTTSIGLSDPAGASVMPSAADSIPKTTTTSSAEVLASAVVGIPVCGSQVPPFVETTLTSTPAPDTCSFPDGPSASPGCPAQPTEVVIGTETRAPGPGDLLSGSPVAGGGRFGGRGGGSVCMSVYPSGAVFLTNSAQGILLPSSGDPLRVAGRTQLARSDAIWGAASSAVDHVELQDSGRPDGVAVTLNPYGPRVRVFIAPVSAGPATITAFGPGSTVLQVVKLAHRNRRCSPGLNPPASSSDLAM